MAEMGKIYIGDEAASFGYHGEQCVYEFLPESTGQAKITFVFLDPSLATSITIYDQYGFTVLTTLTTSPYEYTCNVGDRIKWETTRTGSGGYYRASNTLSVYGNRTQNVEMMPYYNVTFDITPSSGSASSYSTDEWYGRHRSGVTVYWNAYATNYTPANGNFVITEDTVIPVVLTREYRVTITPVPSDATVQMNGISDTSNTFSNGANVEWSVTKTGYEPQSGTIQNISSDTAFTVTLDIQAEPNYLKFNITSGGTLRIFSQTEPYATPKTIQYKVNTSTTWNEVTAGPGEQLDGVLIGTFAAGDVVKIKGYNNNYRSHIFEGTAKFTLSGNLASLIAGDSFTASTPSLTEMNALGGLFQESNVTNAENLIIPFSSIPQSGLLRLFYDCRLLTKGPTLPATSVGTSGYCEMFYNCTALTQSPSISATTVGANSCKGMFRGCTSLVSASTISAMALSSECYGAMYSGCTSLTTLPELPASGLSTSCYESMFRDCTAITGVPVLSATTLAERCYYGMFYNCTSLTTVPALPAATLANYCYGSMFNGCTSLTTTPVLSATTLATGCYDSMFRYCESLTTPPSLPATTLATECYAAMFAGCTGLTSAPVLNAQALVSYCYEEMFADCNLLTSITVYATTNIEGNTEYWVDGITTTGKLYCAAGMENAWLPKGESKCPVNWNIEGPGGSQYTLTIVPYPATSTVIINGSERTTFTAVAGTPITYKVTRNNCVGVEYQMTMPNADTTITGYTMVTATLNVAPNTATITPNGVGNIISSTNVSLSGVTYKQSIIVGKYGDVLSVYAEANGFPQELVISARDLTADFTQTSRLSATVTFNVTPTDATIRYAVGDTPSFTPPATTTLTGNTVEVEYGKFLYFDIARIGYQTIVERVQITGPQTITSNLTQTWTTLTYYVAPSTGKFTTKPTYQIVNGASYLHFEREYNPIGSDDSWQGYTWAFQFLRDSAYTTTISFSADDYITSSSTLAAGYAPDDFIYFQLQRQPEYLTFDIVSGGTVIWKSIGAGAYSKTIQYSVNNGAWTSITSSSAGASLGTFSVGDKIKFKGTNTAYGTYNGYNCRFGGTAKFNLSGNILSLNYGDNFTTATTLGGDYDFPYLFSGTEVISASGLILPATTSTSCYAYMFRGCTELTSTPLLPASGTSPSCYREMFAGCTSLANTPEIKVTAMTNYCCYGMFSGCTSITGITERIELISYSYPSYCCYHMFNGCSSINSMSGFQAIGGNTSTLGTSCFEGMFKGCTLLPWGPTLGARTLTTNCYREMFSGCTSLHSLTAEFTTTPGYDYTYNWLAGTYAFGVFSVPYNVPWLNTITRSEDTIPSTWTIQTY